MPKLTKQEREKIEKIRERKKRVCEKVQSILVDICKDNPEIFKTPPDARTKDLQSILRKMARTTGCTVANLESRIKDIAGARVTCCTKDEIPKAEEKIRKHPDVKNCRTIRKWEVGQDEFGYRGHHLLVTVKISYANKTRNDTCEVQIRTLAMDLWAVLSHRGFYEDPVSVPRLVQEDMKTLSKVLEVVDDLAVTLDQRRRDEIQKEAQERAKGRAQKDMLTPENIQKLVKKVFNRKISLDVAYGVIRLALNWTVVSLKRYARLIAKGSKHQREIDQLYKKHGVEPELYDSLHFPLILEYADRRMSRVMLMDRIDTIKNAMKAVEKGVSISKEKLDEEKKTTQPPRAQKK